MAIHPRNSFQIPVGGSLSVVHSYSKNVLSKVFQILLAQTSARALSAVFDPGGSVTLAVGRSNGSVTTSLHPTLTNSFISETRQLWRILT